MQGRERVRATCYSLFFCIFGGHASELDTFLTWMAPSPWGALHPSSLPPPLTHIVGPGAGIQPLLSFVSGQLSCVPLDFVTSINHRTK